MSLPTLSTLNTTQDTNKQLAQIRSYLVQLKDELEAELSNVTYEMLSASLQKRIDAINDEISAQSEQNSITAQTIVASEIATSALVADAITTANVYADSVSASAISTANAYADSLEAQTLKTVNANISTLNTNISNSYMANATWLTSGNAYIKEAKVENLSSIKEKVGTIEANYITASYINATNICGALSDPSQGNINVGNINAKQFTLYTGNSGYKPIKFVSGTVGGKTAFFAYHE